MVGNEKIEETNSFKMLGFMVDNNLSNEEHCQYIIKKSRKTLSAIKRLSFRVTKESATQVLSSVLMGRIAYAGFLYLQNKKQRKKIEIVIMKAVRIIAKKKLTDKVRNSILLKTLNLTPIETIYKRQTVLEMSKWSDKWDMLFQKMSAITRGGQQNKFRPFGRKHRTKISFLSNMVAIWNTVSHQINEESVKKRKNQIKKVFQ